MAKKPKTEAAEGAGEAAPAAAALAKEGKKGREPKPAKEPKGKEPRGKTAPAVPPAVTPAPAAAPASTAPAAAGGGPAAGAETKKRGKAPGIAPRRGKKLRNHIKTMQQRIAKEGPAPLRKAIQLLKQAKRAKFDETVEIHMSLGVDVTQNDQLVRGSVSLPHGIGKSVRVVVFCQGENVGKAKSAGADDAGSDELIKRIQDGWLDFDVALAMQDMMGKVSRLGKLLGPRGLMPTPKAGTVVTGDVIQAVRDFKAGKVEYRTDKGGNVHAGVGKMSFEEEKLADNVTAFVDQVKAVKPTGVKGHYIKSITLSATMCPGIPVTM